MPPIPTRKEQIIRFRLKMGWTREIMAKRLGCTAHALLGYEIGSSVIPESCYLVFQALVKERS